MSTAETTTPIRQSRTGKRPVALPKGVSVAINNGMLEVKGPKGTLTRATVPNVGIAIEASQVVFTVALPGRDGARFQGLARSLVQGMVEGVSTGYTRTLQLVGTGYRAEVKGPVLNLSLGLSHPVNFPIPQGISVLVPPDSKGTMIVLTGSDKALMGQTAATIRGFRPPSPYGGKGVRYLDEKVRLKAGKAAGKGK